jgi:predicted Rossmann fold flavoprotein
MVFLVVNFHGKSITSMKHHTEHYDVIVIGAGASGMMAAGFAAKNGKRVLVLEKNADAGEKLKITGGGRCNITNYELDNRKLLSHYGDAASFLFSTFSQFSVKDTFTFFEKRKLPLDIQARNRVFPKTQRAYDVYLVMKNFIKKQGVKVIYQAPVIKLNTQGDTITSVDTKRERYTADSYIVATGGVSYPETGSTGDGFSWMKDVGHTIHQPSPDIVPLRSEDRWVKRISGTKLSFMKITFFCDYKKSFSKTGKLLFTHFGLSSPLILNSSREVAKLLKKGHVHAEVDLFPDTTLGSLDKRVINLFNQNKNKDLKNVLSELIPKKLAEVVFEMLRIPDVHKKVHSVSVEERKRLVQIIKKIPITIDGLMGLDRAVLADGGVPLTEIDTRTMKSKLVTNLYLTGDMLHINRPSGGYSLQLCWTTGYVAGISA